MTTNREHIPESIKRAVRQRCGFGCVICGMPVFDYEHIEEYSKVKKHEEHNITLLCPNHHSATTTTKLTKERIIESDNNPYNIRKGNCFTSSYNVVDNKNIDITIGSNTFTPPIFQNGNGEIQLITIHNNEFFSVHAEEHYLCVSFILTNIDGEVLLKADKGNLQIGINNFDYTYIGHVIKINHKKLYDVSIEMVLTNAKVEILKGCFIDKKKKDGFIVDNSCLYVEPVQHYE